MQHLREVRRRLHALSCRSYSQPLALGSRLAVGSAAIVSIPVRRYETSITVLNGAHALESVGWY